MSHLTYQASVARIDDQLRRADTHRRASEVAGRRTSRRRVLQAPRFMVGRSRRALRHAVAG